MKEKTAKDLSLFVLRLGLGAIFLAHGAQNLFGMFGGVGIEGTTKMMESLGFSYPYYSAIVWSCAEFFGGMFLIMGFFARISAILIAALLVVSIYKINFSNGFFIQNGGYEFDLLMIIGCAQIAFMGGGNWSLWDL
ncbi:MAG: DoxX family protein [Candidatus Omnitrophica bacterium]|nr:DoxX family protein [Candidatus Omnitrophota bacterium]